MKTPDETRRDDLFGTPIPMAAALGLVAEQIGDDTARIRLPFNAAFTNSHGNVHGGALLTLLDCALACAARANDPVDTAVITVDLTTHFLAAASGDAIAFARCLRRGRSLAFSQAEVRDDAGNLLATGTATLKLTPRKLHKGGD